MLNTGTIQGGAGGSYQFTGASGVAGAGGAGIVATGNANITNAGSISGGLSGNSGVTPANAIDLSGGGNTLTLQANYSFTGNVVSTSGATNGGDTLALGGDANPSAAFNVSNLVASLPASYAATQYVGFANLSKTGASTWRLSGNGSANQNWSIANGTLQGDANTFAGNISFVPAPPGSNPGVVFDQGSANANSSASAVYAGMISGAGSLGKIGDGTLTLTNTNTYSGGTSLDAGVLSVAADTNLGGAAGGLSFNGGTLRNTANFATARAITLNAGGGTLQTDANLFITGTIGGTGSLTKAGTGPLVLTQDNTYTGGTILSTGVLQIGNGGTGGSLGTGAVTNNAALLFNRSDTFTIANAISGSGTLDKQGAGTLILSGANTYSGITIVTAGTLQLGTGGTTGSITGNVFNNGTLALNRSDNALNLSGVISSFGGVRQNGAGTVTLSGANTYTGGTLINAGVVSIAADNNLGAASGALRVNGGTLQNTAIFTTHRSIFVDSANSAFQTDADLAATGVISGAGSLTKTGAATLTLSGVNSYMGGTSIIAGTVSIASEQNLGNTAGGLSFNGGTLQNTAALTTNRATTLNAGGGTFQTDANLTAAGAIDGSGALSKTGAGTLALTGTNTYTGATSVNAGMLSVNGSITSATTINNGGTLGGNGTVGNVNVLAGGVLAPGNSIGTLTVNGNLTFAPGSVFRVETDAAGNADRVNVVGAPGTLTINGGTVDVRAGAGNYTRNTRYTILSSTGPTTGAFTGVSSNLAFLTPTLAYLPNGVELNLQTNTAPSYSSVAQTPNQASIAVYLNRFANTPGNAAAAVLIQQIDNLTAEQARDAFDSLSGSAHAAASQIAAAMGRNFSNTLSSRMGPGGTTGLSGSGNSTVSLKALKFASVSPALLTRQGDVMTDSPLIVAAADPSGESQDRPVLQSTGGLWGQAMGTGGHTGSNGNGADSRYGAGGFAFGYDLAMSPEWLGGIALAYTRTQWDASTRGVAPASGHIGTPQAGLYARYASGPWRLRLDGTYSDHRFTTDRTVTIGNDASIARSSHQGTEWGFAAQAEYSLPSGDWDVRPLVGLRHAHLSEDGFTETGAGAAGLTVDARHSQNTVASLGMKWVKPSGNASGSLQLSAIASHLMGDNDSPLSSRLAGQAGSFATAGTPLKRTALTLGAMLTGQISRRLSAYADATYEYRGAGQNAFQLVAGLKLAW